jgi:hypothetical protein
MVAQPVIHPKQLDRSGHHSLGEQGQLLWRSERLARDAMGSERSGDLGAVSGRQIDPLCIRAPSVATQLLATEAIGNHHLTRGTGQWRRRQRVRPPQHFPRRDRSCRHRMQLGKARQRLTELPPPAVARRCSLSVPPPSQSPSSLRPATAPASRSASPTSSAQAADDLPGAPGPAPAQRADSSAAHLIESGQLQQKWCPWCRNHQRLGLAEAGAAPAARTFARWADRRTITRSSLGSLTHSDAEPGRSLFANSSRRRLPQKNGRRSGDKSWAHPRGARSQRRSSSDSVVCVHQQRPSPLACPWNCASTDDTKHSSVRPQGIAPQRRAHQVNTLTPRHHRRQPASAQDLSARLRGEGAHRQLPLNRDWASGIALR